MTQSLHDFRARGASKPRPPVLPVSGTRPPVVRFKDANETVNNSNTLQNDNDLVIPVGVNQVWWIEFHLVYNSGATPDIQFAVTVPSGSTLGLRGIGGNAAGTLVENHTVTSGGGLAFQGDGANRLLTLECWISVSTTPGYAQLQWAQNTANVSDTTVLAGSHLLAWQIR